VAQRKSKGKNSVQRERSETQLRFPTGEGRGKGSFMVYSVKNGSDETEFVKSKLIWKRDFGSF